MTTPLYTDRKEKLYFESAVSLLCDLIEIPSLSKEEGRTADHIMNFLQEKGVKVDRIGNNLWAKNKYFSPEKSSLLLNSHHDTVKPNKGYTLDPYTAKRENGKIFGLGSNDAGGCLVTLLHTFLHFYEEELPYNIIFSATAEEEISGIGGVESILDGIKPLEFGIVGEPTNMRMSVAEKGLMVLDCYTRGTSGHAARDNGQNAIYEALSDIEWFRSFQFPEISPYLGPVKMSVTMIDSGYQHNVIPDRCHFVVDIRTTDTYNNLEALKIIEDQVACEVKPRSTRLNSSHLPEDSILSIAADTLGIDKFGSPTSSDQAVMDFPTCKMGPGESERSHTADEFIFEDEIMDGIKGYIALLETIFQG